MAEASLSDTDAKGGGPEQSGAIGDKSDNAGELSLRRLVGMTFDSPLRVAILCGAGFVSGIVESLVLVLILRVAISLTDSTGSVDISLGAVDISMQRGSALWVAAVGAVGLALTSAVTAWLSSSIAAAVMRRERVRTMQGFLDASWPAVAAERSGELQEVLSSGVTQLGQSSMFLSQTIVALLNFAALVLAALLVQPLAAAVVVVVAGLLLVALYPLSRYSRRQSSAGVRAHLRYAAFVSEAVRLAQEFLVFGVTAPVREIAEVHATETVVPYRRGRFISKLMPGLYQAVAACVAIGGLAVVTARAGADVGAVGAVVILLLRASSYSQTAQSSYHSMNELLPHAELVLTKLERMRAGRREPAFVPMEHFESLVLEGVKFRYETRDSDTLTGVSLRVDRGDALAVVGPSGAGKTTLLEILLRLRKPSGGTYEVNGLPASTYSERSWAKTVAYVPQVPQLMVGTVAQNIGFHRGEIDLAAVKVAARLAQVHDEIEALPDGYDTMLGPRHSGVSVGQRQRLGIARALAGRPEVLILDEPTSALDPLSEERFKNALAGLVETMTIILVTHRESTTTMCRRIVRMREGKLEVVPDTSALVADDFEAGAGADLGAQEMDTQGVEVSSR